jgi:hypothetical protein
MDEIFEKYKSSFIPIVEKAVEAGAMKAKELLVARFKSQGKKHSGGDLSPYSKSHGSRRNKAGLQTTFKDLHYSGTMFDNFSEVDKTINENSVTITLSFVGDAHRRPDQKAATNIQVAAWLGEQENTNIAKLSENEKLAVKQDMIRQFGDDISNITIG